MPQVSACAFTMDIEYAMAMGMSTPNKGKDKKNSEQFTIGGMDADNHIHINALRFTWNIWGKCGTPKGVTHARSTWNISPCHVSQSRRLRYNVTIAAQQQKCYFVTLPPEGGWGPPRAENLNSKISPPFFRFGEVKQEP